MRLKSYFSIPLLFVCSFINCITLLTVQAEEGALKWRFFAGHFIYSSPAIGLDGNIYFGSDNNKVYAVKPDGGKACSYTTLGAVPSSPAVASDGSIIYIGCSDGKVYALDPNNCNEIWSYSTGGAVYSSPAIDSDGIIYVGSLDKHLYSLKPNGDLNWKYQTDGAISSSPAIGSDGTIYVGSNDSYLYAINPDGSPKWKYPTGSVVSSSPAIGSDGTIYVGSYDFYLYAINPDGTRKWRYYIDDIIYSSPSLGVDGTIYVGAGDHYVYAINLDGSFKWKYSTGGSVNSSPAVGADGIIYVGSDDNYVHAINPNGSRRWVYQTNGDIRSSPAIGTDGTIYIGSLDKFLYALTSSSEGLVDSSWPKFHHDNQNTGRIGEIVPPPEPTVTVKNPNGGQILKGGTTYDITWITTGSEIDHIKLLYSTDSGGTYPNEIEPSTENDGIFEWSVPNIDSTQVRVKAIAEDIDNNPLAEDESDNDFTIDSTPPSVTVNIPNGGEVWVVGSQYDISWTALDSTSGVASISLFYSTDGGTSWKSIQEDEANDGIYSWLIPSDVSTDCRVKIVAFDRAGNEGFDQSDADFAIIPPPTITRLVPDYGQQGATLDVTIEGADFRDGPSLSVSFSGTGITINSITFVSATEIQINISISDTAPLGSRDVTVTNGDFGVDFKTDAFSVIVPGTSAIIKSVADSPQLAGDEFIVDIRVENVENLFGISFVFNYDTTYIDALSAEKGDFLGDDVIFLDPFIDDGQGTVSIGITRKYPAGGVDGSGVVAKVTFQSEPTTPDGTSVDFTITEIVAIDPDGNPITLTPESKTVIIYRLCVWPGDTNNDGKVDQADVLPLGLYWSFAGPERPDASSTWECQTAMLWNPENATYADANGGGIVDQADVLPIGLNWGKTHTVTILTVYPIGEVQPSIIKPIVIRRLLKNQFTVGIKVKRVSNLFGIAFALKYANHNAIKPLSVEAGDFLGSDVVFYNNVDDSKGVIRIGISRKHPQSGVSGSGIIAKITFQSTLDLPVVSMIIKEITAIDADGKIIPFGGTQDAPNNGEWLVPLPQVPGASELAQNFPNPFNPETWIPFQLKEAADVTISIYDASGKIIRIINLGEKPAGFYTSKETAAYWDGRNTKGEMVASGLYFYAIRAGKFFAQKKMIIVR